MPLKFLLDTDVVTEPLRPKPDPNMMRNFLEHDGEAGIPAPVWHELQAGCARLPVSRQQEAVRRYIREVVLECFPVLDYDRVAADWHAREHARLAATGRTPSIVDGQVAAIAQVNGLTLVTGRKLEFLSFKGLRVHNWT